MVVTNGFKKIRYAFIDFFIITYLVLREYQTALLIWMFGRCVVYHILAIFFCGCLERSSLDHLDLEVYCDVALC